MGDATAMRLRWLVSVSCLLGAGACTKDGAPAPAAEETPEAKRKRACEGFANEMGRTGAIAGQVLVTALDDDPASADRGRAEMRDVAKGIRRELLDKCMQWPEEVMACLPPLGILADGCEERLLAAMDGATPPPAHVPAGPAPAWTFVLPGEPRHVAVTSDGTVLVVGDALMGVRDGKLAWRTDGDFDAWLVSLPGEPSTWVAGREDRVVAFDPADGRERWSATLPAVEDGDEAPSDDDDAPTDDDDALAGFAIKANVQVATRHGDGLLVGDGEARFFHVDPARCAATTAGAKAGPRACVTLDGRLPDEILDSDTHLFVDGNQVRWLWESGVLRAFDGGLSPAAPAARSPAAAPRDWRTLMTARAHETLSHVTVTDGRVVLIVDDEVVELDPTQCRGEAAFAPSEWPQAGAMVIRDADECRDCEAPPPGCRRWRAYASDVTGEAPALLRDGAVVVHEDGYTLALHAGEPRWKVSSGGGGPLATDGTRVLGFSTALREGDTPGVFEVTATNGELRWRTPLPVEVDDIQLALGGAWLAVAYEQTVMLLPLPPA